MSETFHFSLQPSETIIFQVAANIYASYIAAGQVTDENQVIKIKEAITASISLANYVQSIVESDDQISDRARQRLSNTVREEVNVPHV